jgi:hypothetical protein
MLTAKEWIFKQHNYVRTWWRMTHSGSFLWVNCPRCYRGYPVILAYNLHVLLQKYNLQAYRLNTYYSEFSQRFILLREALKRKPHISKENEISGAQTWQFMFQSRILTKHFHEITSCICRVVYYSDRNKSSGGATLAELPYIACWVVSERCWTV